MNKIRLLFVPGLLFFSFGIAFAQSRSYTTANAHSHNDYSRDSAFYKAFRHGIGSIEADVFLVNGDLLVAHDQKEVMPQRNLRKLYLEPLAAALNKDPKRRLQLLIDVKGSADSTLPVLVQQVKSLAPLCSSGRLSILISGNRPLPSGYTRYPDFIWFDDDLVHPHTPDEWARVGMVSLQFNLFSSWKTTDTIPDKDEDRLRRVINSVHAAGKKIRFWDAPDNERAWQELMMLGVDWIGTDRIAELHTYLSRNKRN